MASLVKFENPLFNPSAVQDVLRQINSLPCQGSYIIEHYDGRVSNISFASVSEREVVDSARAWMAADHDIVCIRIPRFNVVLH